MARRFRNGFLCGIPEMFFDICIIWRAGGDMVRRVATNSKTGDSNVDSSSISHL